MRNLSCMKLLDKYIFLQWVKSFLLTAVAITGVIIIGSMFDDLPDFIEQKASFWDILNSYLYLIPSLFPIIIPISLLVSLLFFLGNLRRNNEIVAMQASGLSLFQITRTLWISGLLLTLLLGVFNASIIPLSVERIKKIENKLKINKAEKEDAIESTGLISKLVFDNTAKGRLWYIQRFNELTFRAYGVNVYIRDNEGMEIERIMAREAYFDREQKHWIFKDGRETFFNIQEGEPTQSIVFDEKIFPDLVESPEVMVSLSKKPRHLSLFQIGSLLKELNHEANPNVANYAVKYQSLLASPLSCLIVVAIAIPFAALGVRTNPMVGVSKAIMLFFIYYVIANISGILGSQLVLSAWLAAWLPNFAMIAFAIFLYRKAV